MSILLQLKISGDPDRLAFLHTVTDEFFRITAERPNLQGLLSSAVPTADVLCDVETHIRFLSAALPQFEISGNLADRINLRHNSPFCPKAKISI